MDSETNGMFPFSFNDTNEAITMTRYIENTREIRRL
jgi:hypothetical protein